MSTRFSTAARIALGYSSKKVDLRYDDAFTPERLSIMFDRNNDLIHLNLSRILSLMSL